MDGLLSAAYKQITDHELDRAADTLGQALSIDFDATDVVTALKYVNFWSDRQATVETIEDVFGRGEYLVGQWETFQGFVSRIGEPVEAAVNALRRHVFRQALRYYREVYQERSNRDADLLIRIGRCYKGTGEFDKALRFYQAAGGQKPDSAEVLAELADLLALIQEPSKAKAFFREAFFLDPQRIEIGRLESQLIRRLVASVEEAGYHGRFLKEWIPVFGVLYGVFTVKRELRSIEFGRLKQSIYLLEQELRENRGEPEVIKPRLINRYFWLIDHYVATNETQDKIDEVKVRIRSVDEHVYRQYTK